MNTTAIVAAFPIMVLVSSESVGEVLSISPKAKDCKCYLFYLDMSHDILQNNLLCFFFPLLSSPLFVLALSGFLTLPPFGTRIIFQCRCTGEVVPFLPFFLRKDHFYLACPFIQQHPYTVFLKE